jgi:XTP/dITP diphosphohydrolase
MKLVFATQNKNKFFEISKLLPKSFALSNLIVLNYFEELPENQTTLEGNASEKAKFVYDKFSIDCFADDTGLEIDALDGRPGVYSARYGGDAKDPELNIKKILDELKGNENRNAQFRTVISLWFKNKEYLFEGIVKGVILHSRKGEKGFGYDPVFMPDGYSKSFAEMPIEEKNKISHRALAFNKLKKFLEEISTVS